MQNFIKLGEVDILPLRLQIDRHPEIWNTNSGRTERETSPHHGLSDIWVRYREQDKLSNKESFNEPFFPLVWYPAYNILTEIKPILQVIMNRIGCTALGGTLITKIPPGKAVMPHTDECSWHANTFRTKVYVTIQSNPNVVNWCAGESLIMRESEVWSFDNLKEHSVYNEGNTDRITLMTAMQADL